MYGFGASHCVWSLQLLEMVQVDCVSEEKVSGGSVWKGLQVGSLPECK